MRSLPLSHWPRADREAWTVACRPHVRLQRGGAAAHMKAVTQADLERRYGYFFDHLSRRDMLDGAAPAGGHVTPPTVATFLEDIGPIWRSVTRPRCSTEHLCSTPYFHLKRGLDFAVGDLEFKSPEALVHLLCGPRSDGPNSG